MKKTQIFKQSFEVSNDFNSDACIKAIKNQLGDLAFKELINGEKHSLTVAQYVEWQKKYQALLQAWFKQKQDQIQVAEMEKKKIPKK